MIRKTNPLSIIIYLLQHLTWAYLPFLELVILTHQKPVMCKGFPYQINNLKHHSSSMSISQGIILGIVVIDCLLDLLMYVMQVIYHICSLYTQLSDARNTNQLQYSKRILSIDYLKINKLGDPILRPIISEPRLSQCHILLFQLISDQASQ